MIRSGLSAFLRRRKDPSAKTVVKVPSEAKFVRKVSTGILSGIDRYGIGESGIFDIKLCIEEALRNAMVHGNNSDKALHVTTSYWVDKGVLNIEIEDEGSGFDHAALADPTTALHILKNSGRGVYLIKKLMDSAEYNDKGNRLLMKKRLN